MSEISDVVNKFEIEKAYYYGCKEDLEKAYKQGKIDGAREFAEWLKNNNFNIVEWMPIEKYSVNRPIETVLAEWQKGKE